MHERERPGLRSQLIFGVLNRVTGHSKPIDARRPRPSISAPSHGRRMSSLQPPPPLSPPLPRRNARLTPPPPPSYCPNDETPNLPDWDQQVQSPFMRLPVEIQMLIYEHVIGNRVIHIIRRNDMKGGMGHMSCLTDGNFELCNEMNCRGMKLPTGLFIESRSDHSHLLPLLQSCKMVYSTAVKALYGSNILDFDSMESIISLSLTTLPQRFDSIQHMQIDFRFNLSTMFSESTPSNDSARWIRTWAVIGSMKALQNLKVRISWPYTKFNAAQEKRILQELWMTDGLKSFEVSLPPAWQGKDVDWGDAPFRVVRRSS